MVDGIVHEHARLLHRIAHLLRGELAGIVKIHAVESRLRGTTESVRYRLVAWLGFDHAQLAGQQNAFAFRRADNRLRRLLVGRVGTGR